jgi:predicted nucleotidyltransferase
VHDFFEAADHGVGTVYLFGSVARDVAGPDSDVDLGILYRIPPASTLDAGPLDLEADLERCLQRSVEVVVLNSAPVDLRARVLRTGRLVFERDRAARIRFEVQTRNEAFDFEPILRQYRAPRESLGD